MMLKNDISTNSIFLNVWIFTKIIIYVIERKIWLLASKWTRLKSWIYSSKIDISLRMYDVNVRFSIMFKSLYVIVMTSILSSYIRNWIEHEIISISIFNAILTNSSFQQQYSTSYKSWRINKMFEDVITTERRHRKDNDNFNKFWFFYFRRHSNMISNQSIKIILVISNTTIMITSTIEIMTIIKATKINLIILNDRRISNMIKIAIFNLVTLQILRQSIHLNNDLLKHLSQNKHHDWNSFSMLLHLLFNRRRRITIIRSTKRNIMRIRIMIRKTSKIIKIIKIIKSKNSNHHTASWRACISMITINSNTIWHFTSVNIITTSWRSIIRLNYEIMF